MKNEGADSIKKSKMSDVEKREDVLDIKNLLSNNLLSEKEVKVDESKDNTDLSSPVLGSGKKRTRVSCKSCPGCLIPDCGLCKNCLDKPKFGGPSKIRQRCVKKTCQKKEEKHRLSLSSKKSREELGDANDTTAPHVEDMNSEARQEESNEFLDHSSVALNKEYSDILSSVPEAYESEIDKCMVAENVTDTIDDPDADSQPEEMNDDEQELEEVDEEKDVDIGYQEVIDEIGQTEENSAEIYEMQGPKTKYIDNYEVEGISKNDEDILDEENKFSSPVLVNASRKRKSVSCSCPGCLAPDCDVCKFCLDKPRLGGSNKLRQRCVEKACHMKIKEVKPRKSLTSKRKDSRTTFQAKTKSESLDISVSTELGISDDKHVEKMDIKSDLHAPTQHWWKSVPQLDEESKGGDDDVQATGPSSNVMPVNLPMQLPSGLQIIPQKKRTQIEPTYLYEINSEPNVTIEKVTRRSEPLSPVIKCKQEASCPPAASHHPRVSSQDDQCQGAASVPGGQLSPQQMWSGHQQNYNYQNSNYDGLASGQTFTPRSTRSIKTEKPEQNLSNTNILLSQSQSESLELDEHTEYNHSVQNMLVCQNTLQPVVGDIKQDEQTVTISRSQIDRFRFISNRVFKNVMTIKEASLASGRRSFV